MATSSSSSFLDAFEALGDALNPANQVANLPLSLIDEDPDNPRQAFDDEEIDALAATLKSRGLLQPIVVRPQDAAGRYRLRFGARRFRAAIRAGFSDIGAIIRPGEDDPREALLEQLIENDQREGLSVAELAAAVDRLLDGGLPQSLIAERLGRPKPQISMLAQVRGMPKELQDLAPRLGLRTLFELNAAFKADAGRARIWLKGRRPESITQAEARELAGRPVADRRVVRDPADGSVRDVSSTPAAPQGARSGAASSRAVVAAQNRVQTATFEVSADGVKGTLVLDDVEAPTRTVFIRTAAGALTPVEASRVRIVRVRPG